MAIDTIAAQPVTNRQLVNFVRPDRPSADQESLRSLLAAAGFPANAGASDLTSQVRAFQRSEIAAGRTLVHGADGRAGPETLNALRTRVGNYLGQAEIPTTLSDAQAQRFVAPEAIARTPGAAEVGARPGPGQARVGGGEDAARRALDEALAQRRAGAAEPMTPGEAAREAAANRTPPPPPTTGDLIRRAGADRSRLAQVDNQLRRHLSEPPATPSADWDRQTRRLQTEQRALREGLQQNPQNARFDELEQAQRGLASAQRLSEGWAGMGRSRPEAQRRVAAAQSRVDELAAELGYLP